MPEVKYKLFEYMHVNNYCYTSQLPVQKNCLYKIMYYIHLIFYFIQHFHGWFSTPHKIWKALISSIAIVKYKVNYVNQAS